LNWQQVCDAIGMSTDTMKRRRDADPKIEEAYNKAVPVLLPQLQTPW